MYYTLPTTYLFTPRLADLHTRRYALLHATFVVLIAPTCPVYLRIYGFPFVPIVFTTF